jgi:hypothetical protein
MAGKAIANEDLTVAFTNQGVPSDAVYGGDQNLDAVKIVALKSTKAKLSGKAMCHTGITLTFTPGTPCPFTSALYQFVSGAGSIAPTSLLNRTTGSTVLRLDDTGTCIGGWILKAPPNTPIVCNCSVKIKTAGQSKVVGE